MSPPKKQLITRMHEEALWDKKLLSTDSAMGLIQAVIFYLCKCFGVWQGKELKQIKTEHMKFGEDELGKFVSIDLKSALGTGRIIKRYDDHSNPRSVYKILKTYTGYLANDGPLIVRPISSIKDYIVYSPWPLGVSMIEQTIGNLMQESGYGNNFGNISVCLMAIDILKSFGAGSHCVSSWLLRLNTSYKVISKTLLFKECTTMNCEEKSEEACLVISHLLDPPYPSHTNTSVENIRMKEARLNAAALNAEKSSKFNSWLSNIEKTQHQKEVVLFQKRKKRKVEPVNDNSSDIEIIDCDPTQMEKTQASKQCQSTSLLKNQTSEDSHKARTSRSCESVKKCHSNNFKSSFSETHKRRVKKFKNSHVKKSKKAKADSSLLNVEVKESSSERENELEVESVDRDELENETDEDNVMVSFGDYVIELEVDEAADSSGSEAVYDDSLLTCADEDVDELEGAGKVSSYSNDESVHSQDDLDSLSHSFSDGGACDEDGVNHIIPCTSNLQTEHCAVKKSQSDIPLIKGQGSYVSQVLKACRASALSPAASQELSSSLLLPGQTKDSIEILRNLLQQRSHLSDEQPGSKAQVACSNSTDDDNNTLFSNTCTQEKVISGKNTLVSANSDAVSSNPLQEWDVNSEQNPSCECKSKLFQGSVTSDSAGCSQATCDKKTDVPPLTSDSQSSILGSLSNSSDQCVNCVSPCQPILAPQPHSVSTDNSEADHPTKYISNKIQTAVPDGSKCLEGVYEQVPSQIASDDTDKSDICALDDKVTSCPPCPSSKIPSHKMGNSVTTSQEETSRNLPASSESLISLNSLKPDHQIDLKETPASTSLECPDTKNSNLKQVDISCPLLRSVLERTNSPEFFTDTLSQMPAQSPSDEARSEANFWKGEKEEEPGYTIAHLRNSHLRNTHKLRKREPCVHICNRSQAGKMFHEREKTNRKYKPTEDGETATAAKSPSACRTPPSMDQDHKCSNFTLLSPGKLSTCELKNLHASGSQSPSKSDSNSSLTASSEESTAASSPSSLLLDSVNVSTNSGLYYYLSDHQKNVAYQTLKIHNMERGLQTFVIGDIPLKIPDGHSENKCVGRHTSEINFGDYFPPNTMIPSEAIKLITRQGTNGLEVLLKIDYHVNKIKGNSTSDCVCAVKRDKTQERTKRCQQDHSTA